MKHILTTYKQKVEPPPTTMLLQKIKNKMLSRRNDPLVVRSPTSGGAPEGSVVLRSRQCRVAPPLPQTCLL